MHFYVPTKAGKRPRNKAQDASRCATSAAMPMPSSPFNPAQRAKRNKLTRSQRLSVMAPHRQKSL